MASPLLKRHGRDKPGHDGKRSGAQPQGAYHHLTIRAAIILFIRNQSKLLTNSVSHAYDYPRLDREKARSRGRAGRSLAWTFGSKMRMRENGETKRRLNP